MSSDKKDDLLQSVTPEPDEEQPEIYAVSKSEDGIRLNRRSFLGALGVGLALAGCSKSDTTSNKLETDECGPFKAHQTQINVLAFNSDGSLLASGGEDNTIKLWSMAEGKLLKTIYAHSDAVRVLAFSSDGKTLVSGDEQYRINLCDLSDYKCTNFSMKRYEGNMALSPDGRLLAHEGDDGKIELWDVLEQRLIKFMEGQHEFLNRMVIGADGKLLVSVGPVMLWSLPDGKLIKKWDPQSSFINTLAISADGKLLACGTTEKSVTLWNLPDGKLLKTLNGHSDDISVVAISPDGEILASADDGVIKLWSLPEGKLLNTLGVKGNSTFEFFKALAFSPDGTLLASAKFDGEIKLWNIPDGKPTWCLGDQNEIDQGSEISTYAAAVCTCNTVLVGRKKKPQTSGSSSSSSSGHYWRPN